MSSRKRSSGSTSRGRPKRARSLPSASTATVVPPATATKPCSNVDMEALTTTITAAVTSAVQAAMKTPDRPTDPPAADESASTTAPVSVEEALSGHLGILTSSPTAGTTEHDPSGSSSTVVNSDKLVFSSLALELGGGVTDKIKGKVWANEYVDFGLLLSVTPGPDRYSISINTSTPSSGAQLTLEPWKPPKKITHINQWISAFNTFVSIYVVKFPHETPKLMKYCEIVRDIAAKFGDWVFYDEQFRLLRQNTPTKYPWDAVHWELWLKVTFRGRQTFSIGDRTQGHRTRSHQSPFPKGTCWTFQAGRFCGGGCKFDHKCYKCGAKHPATRCNVDGQKRASAQSPSQTPPQSYTANNARQSRST